MFLDYDDMYHWFCADDDLWNYGDLDDDGCRIIQAVYRHWILHSKLDCSIGITIFTYDFHYVQHTKT